MAGAGWSEKLQRYRALDEEDRRMLLRAAYWLAISRMWLVAVPFKKLAQRLDTNLGRSDADPELLERVSSAVKMASNNVPWRSDCFPQAIAACRLLRRYGYSSTIHLGVDKTGRGDLLAHAWLTCGETVVTGVETMDRYSEIHRFGQ